MSPVHQIALAKVNGVGPVAGRQLLAHFGNAESIFAASRQELQAIPGINTRVVDAIVGKAALIEAEKEMRFVERHGIQVFLYGQAGYPTRLGECPDAPLALYYKGNADLNATRIISIVGTRNATAYGKSICAEFVKALYPYRVIVVSGLAYGIDSHAHRNALATGIPTVGVLGHGLDRIYPTTNREMAAKMVDGGGLLTEFTSGTHPEKFNFPMRNRIIAGMADVTVVVEAAARGGALITAEIANGYHRDVCAFPGNVNQEFSMGCNYLIKTNRAHLITCTKDLEYLMDWAIAEQAAQPRQLQLAVSLGAQAQRVYDAIRDAGQIAIDELSTKLQYPQNKLAITLLELELDGIIAVLPGKVYRLT